MTVTILGWFRRATAWQLELRVDDCNIVGVLWVEELHGDAPLQQLVSRAKRV